jgi:Transposase IS66 family
MASLLIEARDAASAARLARQSALNAAVLDDLVTRYRELAAAGLASNFYRRTATAKDARRIARRFLGFEDLILRFATRPDLDIFSNNEAERTIRPVKVQPEVERLRTLHQAPRGQHNRRPWLKNQQAGINSDDEGAQEESDEPHI